MKSSRTADFRSGFAADVPRRWILASVAAACLSFSSANSVILAEDKPVDVARYFGNSKEWPEELFKMFTELTDDQQLYAVALMCQEWPNSSVGPIGSLTAFNYRFRVKQIISANSMLIDTSDGLAFVNGIETAELADDDTLSGSNVAFIVEGNQTYANVLGSSRTVPKLRAVLTPPAEQFVQAVVGRQGYRLFRLKSEQDSWLIATPLSVTRTTATLQRPGSKVKEKHGSDAFTEESLSWLADKENVKAMQKTKRDFDSTKKQSTQ